MQPVMETGTPRVPPSLHWAVLPLVLFSSIVLGFFQLPVVLGMLPGGFVALWPLVQLRFIRKIDPASKAIWIYALGLLSILPISGLMVAVPAFEDVLSPIAQLTFAVLFYWAMFSARSSMLHYYNSVERIHLTMNLLPTFFLSFLFLQYHLWRIAEWKKTGVLKRQDSTERESLRGTV